MKRRFVVGIDGETEEDVAKFMKYVRQNGLGWFHWFNNFWLLTSRGGTVTAADIRDELTEYLDDKNVVVVQVEGVTWATYGPQGEGEGKKKNISRWLTRTWDTE